MFNWALITTENEELKALLKSVVKDLLPHSQHEGVEGIRTGISKKLISLELASDRIRNENGKEIGETADKENKESKVSCEKQGSKKSKIWYS